MTIVLKEWEIAYHWRKVDRDRYFKRFDDWFKSNKKKLYLESANE